MVFFSKESLDTLKQRIDLVEVLSPHLDLKRSGASYKALCPFHDEKSPSFTVQKGDSHYHCFGCGAHGDAIQFLMTHQRVSFQSAIEELAQRFKVHLELVEGSEENKGSNKIKLKEALEQANRFYHFMLLFTAEGHEALQYLYSRGFELDFIRHFQIGFAPKRSGLFRQVMHAKALHDETLRDAGLIYLAKDGGWCDFFHDRITFPIRDSLGSVIGFSARKHKESTTGGKYVNTPETVLFKKSRVLFGLNYSRKRIAKEHRAIIVEGQIDALRLIYSGFNATVAGQGTAFGEGHVRELMNLGVRQILLALDADNAGQAAASKIGNLFQKEGIDVRMIRLPSGNDPDSYLKEKGPKGFLQLIEESIDYLEFLVKHVSQNLPIHLPAGKNELIRTISSQIRDWEQPLMVHESLRRLAHLTNTPEDVLVLEQQHLPNVYIKRSESIGIQTIDPDHIMESDLLRWLLLSGANHGNFLEIARKNLTVDQLHIPICQNLYRIFIDLYERQIPWDMLILASHLGNAEGQQFIEEVFQKRVNKERAEQHYGEAIQKILTRNWMEDREAIKTRIQSGECSDDEASLLLKKFDELKRVPPKVNFS